MRRFTIASVLSTLLLVTVISAQQVPTTSVPNLIRYGGTLKDAQGAPIASSVLGVTFAIYRQQDGGAAVWMETQNITTDAAGNYSVLLGATTASGLPSDLFSQQEQRWLGVEVQGESEQPRVLMVSVPYAFKAHEAETLGGKSLSDFVLANGATSAANSGSPVVSSVANVASNLSADSGAQKGAASDGPTNFSGSTTDQIVGVTQSGTGAGINATATSNAVLGTASAQNGRGINGEASGTGGIGIYGEATAGSGIGVKGSSPSTSGTGVRGISVATSGSTTGVSGYVASSSGTAGVFNNAAGGNILVGQNNGATKFTVDGNGDVNISGSFTGNGSGITGISFSNLSGILASSQFSGSYSNAVSLSNTGNSFTGSGTGLTGIQFSQLGGMLGSPQFGGTYSNAVTLSNPSNVYYGNGSNLTGVIVGPGSSYYIQNGTSQQSSASFNISGNGTAGGTLSANTVNTASTYQIGGSSVVSISGSAGSLFLGVGAGANDNPSGNGNVFSGYQAGYNSTSGNANVFSGYQSGYNNGSNGGGNVFSGYQSGYMNNGYENTFSGYKAGYSNTSGYENTFYGVFAGFNNTTGSSDIYIGTDGPSSGTESNTIRIGTPGTGAGQQTAAYIAGVYGSTTNGGSVVFMDSTGLLGTGGGSGLVTSFNGRSGTVLPAANDYNFAQLSGTLASSQLSGSYSNTVSLSSSSNVYYGDGSNLMGVNPAPDSPYYVQNGTSQQSSANFNISGNGSANSFNTVTTYQIGSSSVLGIGSSNDQNLFVGVGAGSNNIAGQGTSNVFSGYQAGYSNTYGHGNTFSGYRAGYSNTGTSGGDGSFNVFFGSMAGSSNTTGTFNIFVGDSAGTTNQAGDNDIYIGSDGNPAGGDESDTIRIGTPSGDGFGQSAAYIVGIYNAGVDDNGVPVYVDDNNKLGISVSSRRFKEQIEDMGDSTSPLMKLRPVTFLYKPEYSKGHRTLQYGLIAEEVAEVYPELVAYDKDGQPYTVRYQYLAPMLLNEVQKQYRRAEQQSEIVASQQAQIRAQQQEIEGLRQQLQLQNASLQERLSRLEKLADSQAQTVARK